MVNASTVKGKGTGYKHCFFVKPNARKLCGNHMSVLGWYPYEYIIKKVGYEYWVPPTVELDGSDPNDDTEGRGSDDKEEE